MTTYFYKFSRDWVAIKTYYHANKQAKTSYRAHSFRTTAVLASTILVNIYYKSQLNNLISEIYQYISNISKSAMEGQSFIYIYSCGYWASWAAQVNNLY